MASLYDYLLNRKLFPIVNDATLDDVMLWLEDAPLFPNDAQEQRFRAIANIVFGALIGVGAAEAIAATTNYATSVTGDQLFFDLALPARIAESFTGGQDQPVVQAFLAATVEFKVGFVSPGREVRVRYPIPKMTASLAVDLIRTDQMTVGFQKTVVRLPVRLSRS